MGCSSSKQNYVFDDITCVEPNEIKVMELMVHINMEVIADKQHKIIIDNQIKSMQNRLDNLSLQNTSTSSESSND